ncbi:unnamed protein product [Clonostachys chloroleuca]|uniref:Enoyl reductase (ER) domain-containing protein n=1 Tax=Clonostachys chloroleuca TaxID=1926264 RepID=A0AA35LTE8_9HYPO|nr:unnamed protein product [Clonostachys chloroleuca]
MAPHPQKTGNRAAVYSEPGTLETEIKDLPIPNPGPGEVLIRLHYSGVCHTDIAFCLNEFPNQAVPTKRGQVGGHEGIGEVVALGEGVQSTSVGSKVGIQIAGDACLSCDACLVGGETSCSSLKITGYFTPGTFQQYKIAPARYVMPIPDGLDMAAAAPLMCAGVTVYTALKNSQIRPGDWVVVSGAGGGLGHLGIQYAKAMGGKVIGIDHGSKERFCRDVGADEFLDFTQFQSNATLASRLKKLTGGGAKVALVCSAKSYPQALAWLGLRGTMACIALPEKPGSFLPDVGTLILQELRIIGAKSGNRLDMKECLEFAAQGKVKPVYQLRSLDDLTKTFQQMESGVIQGRVVIDLKPRL